MYIPTQMRNNPFKYLRRTIIDALIIGFQSDYIFEDNVRANKFKVKLIDEASKEYEQDTKLVITERFTQNDVIKDGKSLIVVGRGAIQPERMSLQSGFSEADSLIKMTKKKTFSIGLRSVNRIEVKSMTKTDVEDLAFAVFLILEFFHEELRNTTKVTKLDAPMVGEITPENASGQGGEFRFFTCAIEMPCQFTIEYSRIQKLIDLGSEVSLFIDINGEK